VRRTANPFARRSLAAGGAAGEPGLLLRLLQPVQIRRALPVWQAVTDMGGGGRPAWVHQQLTGSSVCRMCHDTESV